MDIQKLITEKIRSQGKANSTAEAYVGWTIRFLEFCKSNGIGKETRAETAVEKFLSKLANVDDVSANTQNQAFSSLCYFYRHCLNRPLENVSALRSKRPDRIRDVCDQSELVAMFGELRREALLVAQLMYGCSFRIGEVGRIRVKDVSKQRKQIAIRGAKGEKDRIVGYPVALHDAVDRQIESMRVLWKYDVADGMNGVSLPKAFGRKSPKAHLEFAWYYLFCADDYSKCPVSGRLLRHHRDMGHIGRQIKEASQRAGVTKRITSHSLRHSFATHSLENNVPIHVVQSLMGHSDIATTERYLHVTKDGVTSAKSPLEQLLANPPQRAKHEKTLAPPAEPFKLRVVG
jgi:integron integrase